jgi:uncharacterized protein YdeI (YjbR/CyaY-like superfamily)
VRPVFFATAADWRRWLEAHHDSHDEVWVGFYKRRTGKPSITWPESVDEALCFGWIDGLRKSVDAHRYMIRFTPRRAGSNWSAVNVRRVAELKTRGRMHATGLRAFAARTQDKTGVYSYERRKPLRLPSAYLEQLRANPSASTFFAAQAPWYQRTATGWILSAKREETRLKRLAILIEDCARGRRIGPLERPKPS